MLKKDRIGIIIVGYNSLKYLPECLGSIFDSSYKEFKVYFVDNKSSDDSLGYIRKNWKEVEIISLKENFGFAKANNVGVQKAINDGCEYIFLLNPDIVIEKNCLELLYKSRKNNTILQPLILLHGNGEKTDSINTSGNVLHYLGISYVGNYRKNYKQINLEKDIVVASGAAMFIPAKIINKIGLFDEDFFMYHEDVDFSWRARMVGYQINLLPEAIVWHKYTFSKNKSKYYLVERNRLMFLFKNFTVKYLLLLTPIFILNELLMLFYSVVYGWSGLKIKGYIDIVNNRRNLFTKRKKLLTIRVIREKQLKSYLQPNISFSEVNNFLFIPYNLLLNLYWLLIKGFI